MTVRPVSANLVGTDLTRFISALCLHRGVAVDAEKYAREKWPDSPAVAHHFRTIVEAGDTTTSGWASQLVGYGPVKELMTFTDERSIFGRLSLNMVQVPFLQPVATEQTPPTAAWVAEAGAKPISVFTFGTNITLPFFKLVTLTVLTAELVKFTTPTMGALLRRRVVDSIALTLDSQFLDPSITLISGIRPASVTNGATQQTSSGGTAAQVLSDLTTMAGNLASWTAPFWIMSSSTAAHLASLNSGGAPVFPEVTAKGGRLLGVDVLATSNVSGLITLLGAAKIIYARDPVTVDSSNEAFVEMESAPAVGEQSPPSTQSVLKSLFQYDLFALKSEQRISYARTSDASVIFMMVSY